jgi:pilus assembly protein CpaB
MLRIAILVVAIGAGSLAAWLALSVQSGGAAPSPAQAQPARVAEVLVASTDIAPGKVLGDDSMRWQPWPEEAINESFIRRSAKPDALSTLNGSMARSQFVVGEPIREEKLSRNSSGMLAAMLPSGKRAVAISISAESTAGGFILPNDRVDVIHTITRKTDGGPENRSRTLLTNIRVLAVDQKADDAKDRTAVLGKTATLELSPTQAEEIVASQASGSLSLALRSVADNGDQQVVQHDQRTSVRILRAGRSEVIKLQ